VQCARFLRISAPHPNASVLRVRRYPARIFLLALVTFARVAITPYDYF
jgi:hypothetical protein